MKDRTRPWEELGQPVALHATIHCGAEKPSVHCTVTAISERGARLSVPNADSIPDTFMLSFGGGTKVLRQCTVRSRELDHIIVEMKKMGPV